MVVDTRLYDLLGLSPNVNDRDLMVTSPSSKLPSPSAARKSALPPNSAKRGELSRIIAQLTAKCGGKSTIRAPSNSPQAEFPLPGPATPLGMWLISGAFRLSARGTNRACGFALASMHYAIRMHHEDYDHFKNWGSRARLTGRHGQKLTCVITTATSRTARR
jgi:hypothetical protein